MRCGVAFKFEDVWNVPKIFADISAHGIPIQKLFSENVDNNQIYEVH